MRRLVGGIMLAMGILIAGASGLCSLVVVIGGLSSARGADLLGLVLGGGALVLIWGGIPFAIGLGLFYGGRSLLKRDRTLEDLE